MGKQSGCRGYRDVGQVCRRMQGAGHDQKARREDHSDTKRKHLSMQNKQAATRCRAKDAGAWRQACGKAQNESAQGYYGWVHPRAVIPQA